MKHLRQYIRHVLLTEAAEGPTDIPEGYFIRMKETADFAEFEFVKLVTRPPRTPAYIAARSVGDKVYGSIQLYSVEEEIVGPCNGAFMISWAGATDGYGPMLYDLAMEWATANGSGLIADRGSVSPSAREVWDYYLNNRSDVVPVQPPISVPTLVAAVDQPLSPVPPVCLNNLYTASDVPVFDN